VSGGGQSGNPNEEGLGSCLLLPSTVLVIFAEPACCR